MQLVKRMMYVTVRADVRANVIKNSFAVYDLKLIRAQKKEDMRVYSIITSKCKQLLHVTPSDGDSRNATLPFICIQKDIFLCAHS